MTYKELQSTVLKKGFQWFGNDSKPYNLNIVSFRKSRFSNKFTDRLYVAYKYKGKEYIYEFNCTTTAGSTTIKPNTKIALLKEGQYRGSHTLRPHNGRYKALCQKFGSRLPVERYSLVEGLITKVSDDFGTGLNIHRASKRGVSTQVNRWSEGCTVLNYHNEFELFMHLIEKAIENWTNSFTYTVIENK